MPVMTPDHERWEEFCVRLEGPEGCDFKRDEDGRPTWRCAAGSDKTRARAVLSAMGFDEGDIEASCEFFEQHGGYCDCEILFNVDR
jgi:hypothetical protein